MAIFFVYLCLKTVAIEDCWADTAMKAHRSLSQATECQTRQAHAIEAFQAITDDDDTIYVKIGCQKIKPRA
jgi:hypothetical protein